jgi:hypothetical protein
MRLEVTDHDVSSAALQLLSLFEHLVSLADAGSVPQVYFQFAAWTAICPQLVGKHADIDVVGAAD